jgi:hypothetical protein
MYQSSRPSLLRRLWRRLKTGALLLGFGASIAGAAQAQEPGAEDFQVRAERLRARVASLNTDGDASAADALRELGVEPSELGYWPNWNNHWGNWNNHWANWTNWPNWHNV